MRQPFFGPFRLRTRQALRLRSGQALRLRSGQALRLRSGQAGMSLIEATIILMVLFLLTAVMSPAVSDYIEDARHSKAKQDVETIGTTIQRLQRDVGSCLKILST